MNGLQIEHILDLIEQNSARNRPLLRQEISGYLVENEETILTQLARFGEASIPTTFGSIKLTRDDLALVAA